jgi:hypothetical protein
MNGISYQRDKRRSCGKKRLSKSEVGKYLRQLRRQPNGSRGECRGYYCEPCEAWHTSSRPYK